MQTTTIIQWPAVQNLFGLPNFFKNAALCSSPKYYRQFGDSSYAVSDEYLSEMAQKHPDTISNALSLQETFTGPETDFTDTGTDIDILKSI